MIDTCFLQQHFSDENATNWAQGCAERSGWDAAEATRLATCVTASARAVAERAYRLRDQGPVFVKLNISDDAAILELFHEGALGDKPCDCAASQVATERKSSNWLDAQLRSHRMRIERV